MGRIYQFIAVIALTALFAAMPGAAAPQPGSVSMPLLRWKRSTINIAISTSFGSAGNIKDDSDISGAIRRSFDAWEKAANIRFVEVSSDKQTLSPSGPAGDGVSLITIAPVPENLLLFDNDAGHASARTRIFFNAGGAITEADIVLNPYEQFSTDGTIGTFDLEATLTHEIGHLLGLRHSGVLGATMHANHAKNGIFNLKSFGPRTLSNDDLAAARALYGAGKETEACCGRVSGKLHLAAGQPAANYQVWLEDPQTGRVVAEVSTAPDGSFLFKGLQQNRMRMFAQSTSKGNLSSVEDLGIVATGSDESRQLAKKSHVASDAPDVRLVGFNGQLAELAVSVNAGRSFVIYVGAKGLSADKVRIGVNSPFFSIDRDSVRSFDYGEGVTGISLELGVHPEIPDGDYSIFVESETGERRVIVGALTVEQFVNPWFTRVLSVL